MNIPLEVKPEGLYCTAGDFYIDPWYPVSKCVVTHGHGDHARWGNEHYIAAKDSEEILKQRIGPSIPLQTLSYHEKIKLKNAWVSLHPAGHILGSAQVRIETSTGVYVISGDYKRAPDPTCLPFEVLECDLFVTESTFALPIYQWEDNEKIARQIYEWWQENAANDHPSVLFCYALGKAQRILSLLQELATRPIYLHGAILPFAEIYKNHGASLAPFAAVMERDKSLPFSKELILAPPSAAGTPWLKRFPGFRTALASGWMQIRGARRRNGMDRGFVLSDHADWDNLIKTIKETKATKVLTTHGSALVLAKFLQEDCKIDAQELKGLESTDEGEG